MKRARKFKVVQVIDDNNQMLDWVPEQLAEAGIDFSINICWNETDLAKHAAEADLVWSYGGGDAPDVLKGDNLRVLKKCGAILRSGSGTDNVDVDLATELGIIVANTPQAVAAIFDLAKCRFTIVIKNADIGAQTYPVTFGLSFATFDETVSVPQTIVPVP